MVPHLLLRTHGTYPELHDRYDRFLDIPVQPN